MLSLLYPIVSRESPTTLRFVLPRADQSSFHRHSCPIFIRLQTFVIQSSQLCVAYVLHIQVAPRLSLFRVQHSKVVSLFISQQVQLTHEVISLVDCDGSNLDYVPVLDSYVLLQLVFPAQLHFTIVSSTSLEWLVKFIGRFVYLAPSFTFTSQALRECRC